MGESPSGGKPLADGALAPSCRFDCCFCDQSPRPAINRQESPLALILSKRPLSSVGFDRLSPNGSGDQGQMGIRPGAAAR
jgi:hypothetical protein